MKKKILSLLIISVMALNLTGCAMFESEISDIKGNLVGNGYTIDTFDNYGKRVMTTTGDKINIQGNPVETTSYDSDGSIITGYELSSVITITIDGQEIESCGDTCIFTQKGLEPNVDFTQEDIESNDSETEGTPGEAVLTNGSAQTTVAQAKVTREHVRAQNKETLQSIIDNTELSKEEKSDAVAQMVELTKQSETEMEIETLMATKGFSEAVVSLGEDSADVVVNAEELTDANRAQIEDIVTRKSDVKPEKIVITPIHE